MKGTPMCALRSVMGAFSPLRDIVVMFTKTSFPYRSFEHLEREDNR